MEDRTKEGIKNQEFCRGGHLGPLFEDTLKRVRKPGRYINGEWNAIHKDHSKVEVKVALAYPDTYEIGLSNLGLSILYDLLNRRPDTVAERVYAPWFDMEQEMHENDIPLYALESSQPLSAFDIVGFTLQYEMNFTNILSMLNLAGIPFKSTDRVAESSRLGRRFPLVIAGGPCASNPEPVAPFFDAFVIGEGEEVISELIEVYKGWRRSALGKEEFLKSLARVEGVYVPAFYSVHYKSDGRIAGVKPLCKEAAIPVTKRTVDLNKFIPPLSPPVPYIEAVHDRYPLEVMRGCTRSCRFCQAGMIYRPVRERSVEVLGSVAEKALTNTGHDEISLVSLSSADYSKIVPLSRYLVDRLKPKGIAVSLPSLRIDSFSVGLAGEVGRSKQSSLTFAPEAGTQRLRNVINKGVTEEDVLATARTSFASGWRKLKLYFMIGLPTETEADIDAITSLAERVVKCGLEVVPRPEHKRVDVTVNVAPFIPKAHTPFQWVAQDSLDVLLRKIGHLREQLRQPHIIFKWHDPRMSKIEAAIARGDRRLSRVLERAWSTGCRFDGWTDGFDYDRWHEAFDQCDLSIEFYTDRVRQFDEILPWDHISAGVSKEFLSREWKRAMEERVTVDCRSGTCEDCGVCKE